MTSNTAKSDLPNPVVKAIAVALIQVLLVCSLGAKLLYDRKTRPQAWFKTERFDPNLPIRGRYISLMLDVTDARSPDEIGQRFASEIQAIDNMNSKYTFRSMNDFGRECGSIVVNKGQAVAEFDQSQVYDCDNLLFTRRKNTDGITLRLNEPSLYFIADTAKDPTRLAQGEELWVLATIPKKGPPRPVALGVKQPNAKDIRPLDLN